MNHKIWFTLDNNFVHKNILKYCPNRKFDSIERKILITGSHDKKTVKNYLFGNCWNEIYQVYHEVEMGFNENPVLSTCTKTNYAIFILNFVNSECLIRILLILLYNTCEAC